MAEVVRRCDLLVIGAGPGGGSAALHASRLGLSTLIVEADPEVGTPVHCGECLSDLAVKNLDLEIPDHDKPSLEAWRAAEPPPGPAPITSRSQRRTTSAISLRSHTGT